MMLRPVKNIEKTYDRYADQLYRIALAHSANSYDAMDAVQDVFVNYVSLKTAFTDDEHEKAWFIRATINRCHDISRKNTVRSYSPIEDAFDVADEENDLSPNVRGVLDNVPEKYKTVLVLHYLEGFSVNEIADILKISESGVKMRLSRGRDYLKNNHKEEDFYV